MEMLGIQSFLILLALSFGLSGQPSHQLNAAGEQLRAEARKALTEFRSSSLLQRVGAIISTGPTGNNLRDLRLLLAE